MTRAWGKIIFSNISAEAPVYKSWIFVEADFRNHLLQSFWDEWGLKNDERHSHNQRKRTEKRDVLSSRGFLFNCEASWRRSTKQWKTTLQLGVEAICGRDYPGTLPGPPNLGLSSDQDEWEEIRSTCLSFHLALFFLRLCSSYEFVSE